MNKLAFAIVMGSIAVSASAESWSNGNLVTHEGVGFGGADVSSISGDARHNQPFGLSAWALADAPGPFSLADNYTVGASPIRIDAVKVYGYFNFGSTTPENQTANLDIAFIRIYRGTPDSATQDLVYGDFDTDRQTSTSFAQSSNGRDIYRVSTHTGTTSARATGRHIQEVTIGVGGAVLDANTQYYFEWSLSSSTADITNSTFVSVAPLSIGNTTNGPDGLVHYGNGEPVGGAAGDPNWGFASLKIDTEANVLATVVDLPFGLEFTAVPEPGTMIAVGAGLVALAARRRRKA